MNHFMIKCLKNQGFIYIDKILFIDIINSLYIWKLMNKEYIKIKISTDFNGLDIFIGFNFTTNKTESLIIKCQQIKRCEKNEK